MQWSAVVPVKVLGEAKRRLLPDDDPQRPEMALAFASDVLTALGDAPSIMDIVVVTDDPRVQALVERSEGRWIGEGTHTGLNAAAAQGVRACAAGPVLIVAGDLPCLTPEAIELVLRLAQAPERSFLADTQGTGTTMLLAHDHRGCTPAFGERSRARHRELGCTELGLTATAAERRVLARAHRDVDTTVDLWDAVRLGVGHQTRRTLTGAP